MEIAAIKTQLSLHQILSHYGLKADRNHRMTCPFHADSKPSMQVYWATNTVYCFSSNCPTHGKSMDVIDFVMRKESCTKHEALVKCATMIEGLEGKQEIKAHVKVQKREKEVIQQGGELAVSFEKSIEILRGSDAAQQYLEKRCLSGIKNVGYNDGTALSNLKNCLMFPLQNADNQTVSLYGRSITNDSDQRHFYLKGRQGLYPKHPTKGCRLILTESVIDAASVNTEGYEVLALYGTNGLTDEHLLAIKKAQPVEIILFLNGDEAGRRATEKHAEMLRMTLPQTLLTKVEVLEGHDVNSLLVGHNPLYINELVNNRIPIFVSIEKKETEKETEKNGAQRHPESLREEVKNLENTENTENTEGVQPSTVQSSTLNPNFKTDNPNRLIYAGVSGEYQILGGVRVKETDSLKVSLTVIEPSRHAKSRLKLDLYEDKQVEKCAREIGERLNLRADLIEIDLRKLTDLLEAYREELERNPLENQAKSSKNTLQPFEYQASIAFLKDENLLTRLNEKLSQAGIVGEPMNRLLLFVIASSYKMPDPLHALVQGSSGSGKTHLILKIAGMMPSENVITLTRVTDSSFYNYGETDLVHKLVCLEDLDGLKEEAFLAFRELQSRGQLTSSTSVKDEQGNIRGMVRTVRGPIASLSATTKGDVYEDNMSRCFLVAVDESRPQTERIIAYQNQKSAGLIDKKSERTAQILLQNCIRLLQPLEVVNPYAPHIILPEGAHKIRRLNELYQSFIRQVTLLHQFQRQTDKHGRLVSTVEDLRQASRILLDSIVLKVDELDGALRQFYEQLKTYVEGKGNREYEFTQRELRHALRLSKTQMQRYISDLIALEYLKQTGGHINKGFNYKIQWWDNAQALRQDIKTDLTRQIDKVEQLDLERNSVKSALKTELAC
jgi:DNA primase